MIYYFLIAILGLVIGSFISAISYRIPKKIDFVKDCSKCVFCEHKLKPIDLFPFFSWLFLKGKCRYCKKKISIRYPLIELLTCVLFLGISFGGFSLPLSISYYCLAFLFITIFIIDIEHKIIFDIFNLLAFINGLAIVYFSNHLDFYYQIPNAIFGVLFAFILRFSFLKISKKEALGLGDVKLFATIGLLIPLKMWGAFFILSGILGVVFGLIWQKTKKQKEFPFAPSLIIATLICLFL
jgi:leader peptidase (prepilin peptidase)/N-methyltransferase